MSIVLSMCDTMLLFWDMCDTMHHEYFFDFKYVPTEPELFWDRQVSCDICISIFLILSMCQLTLNYSGIDKYHVIYAQVFQ